MEFLLRASHLLGSVFAGEPPPDPNTPPVIFFCQRRARVKEHVFDLDLARHTRWAFYLLPRVFPEGLDPALITIFFGANDMSLPHVNPQQHVPPGVLLSLPCFVLPVGA